MDETVPTTWWHRAASSVRVRITAAATLVFAAAFALGAFVLVGSVRNSLEDAVRADTEGALAGLVDQAEAGEKVRDLFIARADMAAGVQFQVVGDDGSVVAGMPGAPVLVQGAVGGRITTGEVEAAHAARAQIVETTRVDTPEGSFTIAAASPLAGVHRSVDTVVDVLRVGVPFLTVLVGVLVWLLVRRALRPVEELRHEVDEISHGTLHRRVGVPDSNDEIGRLAGTMNDMLGRLERASTQQREFVSDASHELRSPLATMRTTLEVAPSDVDDVNWSALRTDLLAENRRMEELVTALLDLARADDVLDDASAPVVDLADVVTDEAARTRDVELRLGTVEDAEVHGNRDQLTRAVRNLVDNAAQHGATQVAVSVVVVGDAVRVVVDDDGPGIPRDERERVFERFARLGADRSRDDGGAGLGLAIVRATATRHRGSVVALDGPLSGARLVLELPLASVATPSGSGMS